MALTLGKSYLNPKNLLAFALSLTTKGTFNASASPTQVSLSKYRQNSTPAAVSKSEANATNPYAVQVIRAFTDPLAAEAATREPSTSRSRSARATSLRTSSGTCTYG